MMRTRIIKSNVPSLAAIVPLVRYCADRFTYLTIDQWEKEILDGKVSLDGKPALYPETALQGGELIAYEGGGIVEPPIDCGIDILYKDEWFMAVNKTGNLPVHPAGRYFHNTLVFLLEDRCGRKVYPVHRLDRETSGVMLLAFDSRSAGKLADSLSQGSKMYLALVHGNFPDEELLVELPLGRDPDSAIRKKRKAWLGGTQQAATRFRKVLTTGDISLIRCFPETGRLHQIRSHLLAAGFPIVGDKLYGKDETAYLTFIEQGFTPEMEKLLILPRSALHTAEIAFRHPQDKREMIIQAPLPKMFFECIASRKANGDLKFRKNLEN